MNGESEMNGSNESENLTDCSLRSPHLQFQFWYVTVFGSFVAAFSITENIIVLSIYWGNKTFHQKQYIYLIILALFDIIFCLANILILSVCIYWEYMESVTLMRVWFGYVRAWSTATQIVQSAVPFLLVAAAIEKFTSVYSCNVSCGELHRAIAVLVVIGSALILKGSYYMELRIASNPDCNGTINELGLTQSELVENRAYREIWMFWVRNIFGIFGPFFTLLFLNIAIVWKDNFACLAFSKGSFGVTVRRPPNLVLKGQTTSWVQRARNRVRRAATRTLIALVLCYLISQSLDLCLRVWEFVDIEGIMSSHQAFHTYAADTVSILSCLVTALRLPIYCVADLRFRKEAKRKFPRSFQLASSLPRLFRFLSSRNRGSHGTSVDPGSPDNSSTGDTKFASLVLKALDGKKTEGNGSRRTENSHDGDSSSSKTENRNRNPVKSPTDSDVAEPLLTNGNPINPISTRSAELIARKWLSKPMAKQTAPVNDIEMDTIHSENETPSKIVHFEYDPSIVDHR